MPTEAVEPREILLQWRLPLRPADQRRALDTLLATIRAYRRSVTGMTGYYAARHWTPDPDQAWFVAFAEEEHAAEVIDRVGSHFPGVLEKSTTDPILGDDLAWYRLRLQHVTEIALSVTEDQQTAAYKRLKLAMSGVTDPMRVPEGTAPPDVYEQILKGPLTSAAPGALERRNGRRLLDRLRALAAPQQGQP